MGNSVQQKKIELIQLKLSKKKKKTSELAKKRGGGRGGGLRNKANQQRDVWRNSKNNWGRENLLPFNLEVLQNFVSMS